MHVRTLGAHAGREAPYQSLRDDRLVSAVTLANGKAIYLRSALLDGFAISMQVVHDPWQDARADLIAFSMQWGSAPDLLPSPVGRSSGCSRPSRRPRRPMRPRWPLRPKRPRSRAGPCPPRNPCCPRRGSWRPAPASS
jgi:hypothetical protein